MTSTDFNYHEHFDRVFKPSNDDQDIVFDLHPALAAAVPGDRRRGEKQDPDANEKQKMKRRETNRKASRQSREKSNAKVTQLESEIKQLISTNADHSKTLDQARHCLHVEATTNAALKQLVQSLRLAVETSEAAIITAATTANNAALPAGIPLPGSLQLQAPSDPTAAPNGTPLPQGKIVNTAGMHEAEINHVDTNDQNQGLIADDDDESDGFLMFNPTPAIDDDDDDALLVSLDMIRDFDDFTC